MLQPDHSPSHVFISHSTHDDFFVSFLAKEIEKKYRRKCWHDKKIVAGFIWRAEIKRQMRSSFAVILVISPDALKSDWVHFECGLAHALDIPIIPILYRDVDNIPTTISETNYASFIGGDASRFEWENLEYSLNLYYKKHTERHVPNFTGKTSMINPDMIIKNIKSQDLQETTRALELAAFVHLEEAIEPIKDLLFDPNDKLRELAIPYALHLAPFQVTTIIVGLLSDPAWSVRQAAKNTLSEHISHQLIDQLIEQAFNSRSATVIDNIEVNRVNSIMVMGNIGRILHYHAAALDGLDTKLIVERIGQSLIRLLDDSNPDVRARSLIAIGNMRYVPAIEKLRDATEDSELAFDTRVEEEDAIIKKPISSFANEALYEFNMSV